MTKPKWTSCWLAFLTTLAFVTSVPLQAQDTMTVVNDNVGIGTETPAVPMHIVRSTGSDVTEFRLENSGGNRFDFVNTLAGVGGWWQFINSSNGDGADLVIRELTHNTTEELRLTQAGQLTISGALFTGGFSCGSGCDRVFDPDYELESIEEHAAAMWSNGHLPEVGPTVEGETVNLTEKTGRMLNELEKAHIYIEQVHREIADLHDELAERDALLTERLAEIEAQLDR